MSWICPDVETKSAEVEDPAKTVTQTSAITTVVEANATETNPDDNEANQKGEEPPLVVSMEKRKQSQGFAIKDRPSFYRLLKSEVCFDETGSKNSY